MAQRQGFVGDEVALIRLHRLMRWARQIDDPTLVDTCAFYARATPWAGAFELPAPTGERNRLRLFPRGRVLCDAADEGGLLHQLAAVWATGNAPLVLPSAWRDGVVNRLPPDLRNLVVCVNAAPGDADAVLCDDDGARAQAWVRAVCPIPEAIVPVVCLGRHDGRYALYRLLAERTLTLNTTAAGGNARLLSVQD